MRSGSGWLLEALGAVMGREGLMRMRVRLLKRRGGAWKRNSSACRDRQIPGRGGTALLAGLLLLLLLLLGDGRHRVDGQIRGGELVGGRVRIAGIGAHHGDERVGGRRKLMAARLLIGGRGHGGGRRRHLVAHVGGAGGRGGWQERAWVGDRCREAVARRRADGRREPGRVWRQLVGHGSVVRGVQLWN